MGEERRKRGRWKEGGQWRWKVGERKKGMRRTGKGMEEVDQKARF